MDGMSQVSVIRQEEKPLRVKIQSAHWKHTLVSVFWIISLMHGLPCGSSMVVRTSRGLYKAR